MTGYRPRRLLLTLSAVTVAVVILCAGAIIHGVTSRPRADTASRHPTINTSALPEARYDAVIADLMPFRRPISGVLQTYTMRHSTTVLYGADHQTPVATLPKHNFANRATVATAVRDAGTWTMILTPARQQLPSTRTSSQPLTPAQTSAWVHTADLQPAQQVRAAITVHLDSSRITITNQHGDTASWSAAIGAPGTPTPTDVTGYLQERYLDPAQRQSVHRIQLSSLHATGNDEPYHGHDGGLIGIHYAQNPSGATTHGCIRVTADTITAIDKLPLGTPITITH